MNVIVHNPYSFDAFSYETVSVPESGSGAGVKHDFRRNSQNQPLSPAESQTSITPGTSDTTSQCNYNLVEKKKERMYEKATISGKSNLYVSNIPPTYDDEKLRQMFSHFGLVLSAKAMTSSQKSGTRYGFVQFTETEMALHAIEVVDKSVIEGHRVRVKLANRDKNRGIQSQPSCNVYVNNVPARYGSSDVYSLFASFGKISSMAAFSPISRTDGCMVWLIRFVSLKSATDAIQNMNGKLVDYMTSVNTAARVLEVKFAENKQDKMLRQNHQSAALGLSLPAEARTEGQFPADQSDPCCSDDGSRQITEYDIKPLQSGSRKGSNTIPSTAISCPLFVCRYFKK